MSNSFTLKEVMVSQTLVFLKKPSLICFWWYLTDKVQTSNCQDSKIIFFEIIQYTTRKTFFFGVFYSSRVQQIHASHKPPQFRRKLAAICHTCKFSVHPKTTPNPPTLTTPTPPHPIKKEFPCAPIERKMIIHLALSEMYA